jgi:hypothetical protein
MIIQKRPRSMFCLILEIPYDIFSPVDLGATAHGSWRILPLKCLATWAYSDNPLKISKKHPITPSYGLMYGYVTVRVYNL